MAYTVGTDLTWEQYEEILKIAADNSLYVFFQLMYKGKWVEIEGLPVGCGYGTVNVRIAKSHRTAKKMRDMGAEFMYPATLKNSAYIYRIANTLEMLDKVKAVGATITRPCIPVVRIIIPNEESIKQVGKE